MGNCLENTIGGMVLIAIIFGVYTCKTSFSNQNQQVAENISIVLKNRGLENVAIAYFEVMDNDIDGRVRSITENYLEDKITGELTSSFLNVIDRSGFNDLLREKRLVLDGFVLKDTQGKTGQMKGIKAIITGKYNLSGNLFNYNKLYVSYRVIDIEQGKTIYSDEFSTKNFSDLYDMIN